MGHCVLQPNLDAAFGHLAEFWSPRVVAAANGQFVKIANEHELSYGVRVEPARTKHTGDTVSDMTNSIEEHSASLG